MLKRWPLLWRENGFVTKAACLMEGNGYVREVGSLMWEEWSCYGGGQFKGGRMVMLQRQPV